MTIRNLEYLLKPRSIALIGASAKPGSVGLITARNLRAGGFAGPVWLVNPKYRSIEGQDCYPSICGLPALSGDLAFVSQWGALITAIIDWARGRNIGFSQVVSLGDMTDVDFGQETKPSTVSLQTPISRVG